MQIQHLWTWPHSGRCLGEGLISHLASTLGTFTVKVSLLLTKCKALTSFIAQQVPAEQVCTRKDSRAPLWKASPELPAAKEHGTWWSGRKEVSQWSKCGCMALGH